MLRAFVAYDLRYRTFSECEIILPLLERHYEVSTPPSADCPIENLQGMLEKSSVLIFALPIDLKSSPWLQSIVVWALRRRPKRVVFIRVVEPGQGIEEVRPVDLLSGFARAAFVRVVDYTGDVLVFRGRLFKCLLGWSPSWSGRRMATDVQWQMAEVILDHRKMFILWMIRAGVVSTADDFQLNFGRSFPAEALILDLKVRGLIAQRDRLLLLTPSGNRLLSELDPPDHERARLRGFGETVSPNSWLSMLATRLAFGLIALTIMITGYHLIFASEGPSPLVIIILIIIFILLAMMIRDSDGSGDDAESGDDDDSQ